MIIRCMVLVSCANIGIAEKNRFSEYKIIVYADHLSFLGKWSFLLLGWRKDPKNMGCIRIQMI